MLAWLWRDIEIAPQHGIYVARYIIAPL